MTNWQIRSERPGNPIGSGERAANHDPYSCLDGVVVVSFITFLHSCYTNGYTIYMLSPYGI